MTDKELRNALITITIASFLAVGVVITESVLTNKRKETLSNKKEMAEPRDTCSTCPLCVHNLVHDNL